VQIMSASPGTTLGPHSLTAKFDDGGVGEVYQARARDASLTEPVASQ